MLRAMLIGCAVVGLTACERPRPTVDAGEEDAGEDAGVDAGRPRGDDPPTGWTTAIELPADAGPGTRLGVSVASAPDQFGQPLVAGVHEDPNGDGSGQDTRVFFTRWNGTERAFEPLKTVEVVGPIATSHPLRQVAIARDATTGRIGIVYAKSPDAVRYAWSDDEGANFSLTTVSKSGGPEAANPQLALKGETLFVAYSVQGGGVVFRKRVGASAFEDLDAPVPSGSGGVAALPISLRLDSAGNPGVAYFGSQPSVALAFWRPGTSPTVIADSASATLGAGREPSVTLTFAGDKPRVAYHLRNSDQADAPELFYAAANDAAGTQWATPVAIPRTNDGTKYHSTGWYQSVSVDAAGKVAVAADFTLANGLAGAMCGGPKLARSSDGSAFTTCAPSTPSPINIGGDWNSLWTHTSAGKLTLIFAYDTRSNPSVKPGVVMWREP